MCEMTELEELQAIYCEMHKDVYGVKARWYKAESVEQALKDIENLSIALDAELKREQEAQHAAIAAFERLAQEHCGGDIVKAKRWQHQACNTNGDDEYLEYHLGLPYGYFHDRCK